jgi:hypothetical protein
VPGLILSSCIFPANLNKKRELTSGLEPLTSSHYE